jgi:CubicO group peptidase (beta-lactamase class C family)
MIDASVAQSLQSYLDQLTDNKKVFGTAFGLKRGANEWLGSSGNLTPEKPFFIASATKLFITAMILQLRSENKIALDEPIHSFLPQEIISGLHVYKGKAYSDQLRVRHLLAHTSGLADYFQGKQANGKSLLETVSAGKDQAWTFEQTIAWTKSIPPLFAPDTPHKAHYSDTNFQLLGRIIEIITAEPLALTMQKRIIQPLNLRQTYLYQNPQDDTPLHLYYRSEPLRIPLAMASFGADGGVVATARELLAFIEAFFTGKLFPAEYLPELQVWNKIFFPMQSGIGIHLFRLPWFFDPFRTMPALIGHSGLSGAVAFFDPQHHTFIAGTVNQVAHPDLSFRVMVKLVQFANKAL